MLNFSKSVLKKKQIHLHLGWPEREYIFSKLKFLDELFLSCRNAPIFKILILITFTFVHLADCFFQADNHFHVIADKILYYFYTIYITIKYQL